jgi:hypothetical protein
MTGSSSCAGWLLAANPRASQRSKSEVGLMVTAPRPRGKPSAQTERKVL